MRTVHLIHADQHRPRPPVDQRVQVMDTLDREMKQVLTREDVPAEDRLKLHDQALFRYRNVLDDYRPSRLPPQQPATQPTPETETDIEREIMESVPKSHKGKAALLLKRMKASPDISWNEKGELKYKGDTVRGSNVVDLVNDVLRKRKTFNPEGWETFGDALREANVPQDLVGHEDRWQYIRKPRSSPIRLPRTPRSVPRQIPRTPNVPQKPPSSPDFFTPKTQRWSPYPISKPK